MVNQGGVLSGVPQGASGHRRRPAINLTPPERLGRIAIGGIGAVIGAVLAMASASVLAVVLEVLLVVAGLDLVVTGALGHCPLYQKFGYVPSSLRSRP